MSEILNEEEFIETEDTPTEEMTQFVVDDDEKANWCLQRISDHKAEIEKWTAHYDAEKRRATMRHENAIFSLRAKLRDYFINRSNNGLTHKTKTKESYKLPNGEIFIKSREPEFAKDEAVMIEWLRKNAPQFIKTKETVDWAGMKAAFWDGGDRLVKVDDETGEIITVPGVTVTTREAEFSTKEN